MTKVLKIMSKMIFKLFCFIKLRGKYISGCVSL